MRSGWPFGNHWFRCYNQREFALVEITISMIILYIHCITILLVWQHFTRKAIIYNFMILYNYMSIQLFTLTIKANSCLQILLWVLHTAVSLPRPFKYCCECPIHLSLCRDRSSCFECTIHLSLCRDPSSIVLSAPYCRLCRDPGAGCTKVLAVTLANGDRIHHDGCSGKLWVFQFNQKKVKANEFKS